MMIPASLMACQWCLHQQVQGTSRGFCGSSCWPGDRGTNVADQTARTDCDNWYQLLCLSSQSSGGAHGLRRDLERVLFIRMKKVNPQKPQPKPPSAVLVDLFLKKKYPDFSPIHPLLLDPKQSAKDTHEPPKRSTQSCRIARSCFLWPPQDPHPRRSPRSAAEAAPGNPSPSA